MFIFPVGTKNIKIGAHKEQYSSRVCWKWNFPPWSTSKKVIVWMVHNTTSNFF